ncbi:MAG: glycosyltransferase family protein [Bacteroidota bacterium]|jgi:uncharacterized protein (TIGR00661 family)
MIKKRFIFFVQGEGRGHMTQAIAMKQILIEKGHEVVAVVIGMSERREIPDYVKLKFDCPIERLDSPNFVTDKKNKGIRIPETIAHTLINLRKYTKSLNQIKILFKVYSIDAVINFFDPLVGLFYLTNKCNIPHICVAHQYIYHHEEFKFPRGRFTDRFALKWFTGLTGAGSIKRMAISFYELSQSRDNKIKIVPPLLRDELFDIKKANENYFLVYLVNNGYLEDIIAWHKKNPEKILHCFTDTSNLPDIKGVNQNFQLHQLNDKKFLEMMATAKAMVSTAGFESVCEAMYLNKPVLMVPVAGHFEQFCNARDAFLAGAGLYSDSFKISKIVDFSEKFDVKNENFINWVNSSKEKIYKEIQVTLT